MYEVVGVVTAGQLPPNTQLIEGKTIVRITTGNNGYIILSLLLYIYMSILSHSYSTLSLVGSAVPDDADSVIMVEKTELLPEKSSNGKELVRILENVKAGHEIRAIGSDIAVGEIVLRKVRREIFLQWNQSRNL